MLSELIALLTGNDLQGEELAEVVACIEASPDNPELAWVDGETAAEFIQFAVVAELGDFVLIADKVDELHTLVSDQFAEPLPDFPESGMLAEDYFRWLDGVLAARQTPWELLLWGVRFDDNLYAFVVRRGDSPRILALAEAQGLLVERATQRHLT
ncbi:MAG: hypothetical protein QM581_11515 [Pseudomonas sp.]